MGNAGAIKIKASETISIAGEDSEGDASGIFSTVDSTAIGNSGGSEIITGSLSLTDGAVVNASTFGQGNAGTIRITATNTISLSGKNNQGLGNYINSEVKSKAEGNAGKIEIITGSLSLNDGANVSASSLGKGNAGSIKITASDTISATGEDNKGNLSGIFIQVTETAEGNSGDIEIYTGSLFLSNGAQVNTNTFGKVDAGAIKIIAGDTILAVGESNLGFNSGIYSVVAETAEGSSRGIEISTGSLFLTDGAVVDARTLGKGDAGVIKITATDTISLSGEDNQGSSSYISSRVDSTAIGNSGGIEISTGSLFLKDGANVSASILGKGNAGVIKITATDTISLSGESSQDRPSAIFGQVVDTGSGNSGGIEIFTGSLFLTDGAVVDASTFSQGNAGGVKITARDTISLSGEDSQGSSSFISSTVDETVEGNSGGIEIITGSLFLSNGAAVSASTLGKGNAGAIKITATDTISLSGENSQDQISRIGSVVGETAEGNSGGIEISTGSLSLTDGAVVSTSTDGRGNAGAIRITASETISLNGLDSNGLGSYIRSIVASTAEGNSGGIEIITGFLSLSDGAQLNASTFGVGDAGGIIVQADGSVVLFNSNIFNNVESGAVGNAGGIFITAQSLFLTQGSQLQSGIRGASDTLMGGRGNGGNVSIDVRDTLSLTGVDNNGFSSAIYTDVEVGAVGNGGNIKLKAGTLSLADDAQLNAITSGEGNAGSIEIITGSLSLVGGAQVSASSFGVGDAGVIKITASETISITGEDSQKYASGIFSTVETTAEGNSGGIEITTGSLSLSNGAAVNASTFGRGNAGAVKITASDTISIAGEDSESDVSGIFSTVAKSTAQGNSGGIEILTGSLSLTDGAVINASTFGRGNAGAVKITARDTIFAVAENRQGFVSGIFSTVAETAEGISGGIKITTGSLSLTDGAAVNASTFGKGNAGAIRITASETITAVGEDSQKYASGIFSTVEQTGQGNSGGIEIITGSLSLSNGAAVNASTFGQGNAGAVELAASETITAVGEDSQGDVSGIFSTVGNTAQGNSEGIEIITGSLSLSDGAAVDASTLGRGNAGAVKIRASDIIFLTGEDSQGDVSSIASAVDSTAIGNSAGIEITTSSLSLNDKARVSAETLGAGTAGNISITANTLENTNASQIQTNTQTNFDAGDITLNISDTFNLSNSSLIAKTTGEGKAGNITIHASKLNLIEGATISAGTSAQGDGGSISIKSPLSITLGENSQLNVETSGAGRAGNIEITSNTVTIGKDAQISATATRDASNTSGGGSININASNLNIAGKLGIFAETQGISPAGTLTLNPDSSNPNLIIRFIEQGLISASTTASGNGGDINISAPNNIDISGNGTIATSTSGSGSAGTINFKTNQLNLTSGVTVTASTTGIGNAGDITFNITDYLSLTNSTIEASTDPNSTGNGGNINIDPKTVNLNNNARISVNSQGLGDGGNLSLISENLFLNERSSISATTASGEGGNITLNVTDTVTQRNNSPISATAGGTGNGGNITMNTRFLVGNENSNITANAFQGRGGNINITADGIFRGSNSPITASSQLGVDGVVDTNTPEVDPSRGLLNLPQNPVDPNTLIAQNACRRGGESEFTVTGRGGLPNTPEQVQRSNEVEVGLVDATEQTAITQPKKEILATRKIIPAQGWQRNGKGEMVLVATPTTENTHRQTTMTNTCSLNQ